MTWLRTTFLCLFMHFFCFASNGLPDRPASRIDEIRASHWSYQPIKHYPVPNNQNPIDYFIQKKLKENGLSQAPKASKYQLGRRLYLTITGLTPSYDEMKAFINDKSPNATEKLINKLLASPQYGERWGRHWLDVARYADTKGYLPGSRDTSYPFAYTYRDYVVRSFNEDKPFNRFIMEQIAADLIPDSKDKRNLAALGFLTVGPRFLNNVHSIIDDRIDAFMLIYSNHTIQNKFMIMIIIK